MATGYIGTHQCIGYEGKRQILKTVTLHQIIMDYYGNGLNKSVKTIDHINRNKLDNRLVNLRLESQSEQNRNRDKCARQYNARALPDGILQKDIPKYVEYTVETIKKTGLVRDFFKVSHPILGRTPANKIRSLYSSKSTKVSANKKLAVATNIVNRLYTIDRNTGNMPNIENVLTERLQNRGKERAIDVIEDIIYEFIDPNIVRTKKDDDEDEDDDENKEEENKKQNTDIGKININNNLVLNMDKPIEPINNKKKSQKKILIPDKKKEEKVIECSALI
jgi:hypothetical protein